MLCTLKPIFHRLLYLVFPPLLWVILSCSTAISPYQSGCRASDFPAAYARLTNISTPLLDAVWDSDSWRELRCAIDSIESTERAEELRWIYVSLRENRHSISGYKLALGSAGAQALFGLTSPVLGVFFSDTLLPNNSEVSLTTAENLAYEPDLLVKIKGEGINHATTVEEIASNIESVAAFIELPDLLFPAVPASGPAFIASNAAVRYGVVGDWVDARDDSDFIAALANMQVVVSDQSFRVLLRAEGRTLMGHPYRALLPLLEQLRRQQRLLRAGDVVSLGAFAPPRPIGDLRKLRVDYHGLTEGVDAQGGGQSLSVTVRFLPDK